MRISKIAALAGLASGVLWIVTGILAWGGEGLDGTATTLWWAGLGLFALASAGAGYAGVTAAPLWLRGIVVVGAGALGASVVSLVDIDSADADLIAIVLGAVLLVASLVALALGRRSEAPAEVSPQHGRRAAR